MLLTFLVLSEKNVKILLVFAVFCLVGTVAKTAWIAAGVVSVRGLWLCRKISKKQAIGFGLVLTAGLALLGNIENDGIITGDKKLEFTWSEERGEFEQIGPKYEGLHFKVYLKDDISYAVFRYEDVVFRFMDHLGTGIGIINRNSGEKYETDEDDI